MAHFLVVVSQFVNRPAGKITELAIVALSLQSSGVSRFHVDRVIEFPSLLVVSLGLLVNFEVAIRSAGKITRLAKVLFLFARALAQVFTVIAIAFPRSSLRSDTITTAFPVR